MAGVCARASLLHFLHVPLLFRTIYAFEPNRNTLAFVFMFEPFLWLWLVGRSVTRFDVYLEASLQHDLFFSVVEFTFDDAFGDFPLPGDTPDSLPPSVYSFISSKGMADADMCRRTLEDLMEYLIDYGDVQNAAAVLLVGYSLSSGGGSDNEFNDEFD